MNYEISQYRVLIFDVNGTLLGHEDPRGFEKRFARACHDMGEPVTVDQVHQALSRLVEEWTEIRAQGFRRASSGEQYRRTMTRGYQLMLEALGVRGNVQQKAEALYERFIVREEFMPLFRDVEETLTRLRGRGIRLGVLSNFPPHLEETLKQHGIHEYFDEPIRGRYERSADCRRRRSV